MNSNSLEYTKPKFYYVMDPLCGWCYGFANVIEEIYDVYNHLLDFKLVTGGLMVGKRVGTVKAVAPFIPDALHIVEEKTGAKFGELFVENIIQGDEVLDSQPSNLILKSAEFLNPKRVFTAAHFLQKAHYLEGIPSQNTRELCYAIERAGYKGDMLYGGATSSEAERQVQEDYQWVREMGIQGFPCILIEYQGNLQMMSQGYLKFEEVKQKLELLIPEITQYY